MRNKSMLCFSVLLCVSSCILDSENQQTSPHANNISVRLTTDKYPSYMGTATLTCTYEVVHEPPNAPSVYVAKGYFNFPSTHFRALSGDSSWVDSVRVHEPRTHHVVVRALRRGDWLVDALVSSVIEPDVYTIGGVESIELHVK